MDNYSRKVDNAPLNDFFKAFETVRYFLNKTIEVRFFNKTTCFSIIKNRLCSKTCGIEKTLKRKQIKQKIEGFFSKEKI